MNDDILKDLMDQRDAAERAMENISKAMGIIGDITRPTSPKWYAIQASFHTSLQYLAEYAIEINARMDDELETDN